MNGWRAQFGHPRGLAGALIGCLMAVKNRARSEWVLSLLHLKTSDRVLEIGFGPGVDIRRVRELAPEGFIAGIDHSELMLRQASRRNAAAIARGSVELRQGDAGRIPYAQESFDKIFSINCAQFWRDRKGVLAQVFASSGRVVLRCSFFLG